MNTIRSNIFSIPRNFVLDAIDALQRNCVFFACEGFMFPPIDQKTCVNCQSAWELKMVICGYTKKEINYIRKIFDREYWRHWKTMEECNHTDEYYDNHVVCKFCSQIPGVNGGSTLIASVKIMIKENKEIHAAMDLMIDFHEQVLGENCEEIKETLFG